MPRNSHQRKRRSPALEGSDDESDGTIAPEELETEEDENEGSMDQLVKKFVRYALACEYSRIPIKRDGMREKGTFWARRLRGHITDLLQSLANTKHHLKKSSTPHRYSFRKNLA